MIKKKAKKIIKSSLTGAGVIIIFILGGWGIFETNYWDKIYPGIKVNQIKIGGITRSQARKVLEQKINPINSMTLQWGTSRWDVSLEKINSGYDLDETIKQAYGWGRNGNWISNRINEAKALTEPQMLDISLKWDVDKVEATIKEIAEQIDVPAQEPEIKFDNQTKMVSLSHGENGQRVDREMLSLRMKLALVNMNNNPIDIPVIELRPKLNDDEVNRAKSRVERFVGKKAIVSFEAERSSWEINEAQIMSWLDPAGLIKNDSGQGLWKRSRIENWVADLAGTVDRNPQNAFFKFVASNKVEEFKPAKNGYRVNQPVTTGKIIETLNQLENTAVVSPILLSAEVLLPEVGTDKVNDLGINELIGRGESWFSGSIDNRIFNIKKSADALNGILVAPGQTFSFNEAIGEVSQNTGYKPAYIIKEGKTILGDGGGVCQTSSTLFRAVLHAGLPITQRIAHAYRVSYYEEKSEPGFDATVFQPAPDFNFINDTPAHILIQTNFDPSAKKLTFDIYGSDDGRQVTISKARIWDQTPPPPDLYQDDPTLNVGVVRQIEHPAWGAKVAFDWKVTRQDQVLQERTFYSNYQPWQAVYLKGTKTQ